MTVTNKNPVADSLLNPADSISFTLTPNGAITSLQVTIIGASTEVAVFNNSFQPGYGGTQVFPPGGGDDREFVISRTAGWDASPFTVKVDWSDDSGGNVDTWSYELANENLYPDLMQPRNPVAQGTLIATDAGVPVRTDVGWVDLVGFTVTDLGNGKVRITDSGGAGGSTSFWDWGYETGGGVPSNGKFTADSDSIDFITSISLDDTSGAGPIITGAGVNIKVGDYIALKSGDASLHATYQVTSATNNLGYWTYGVLFSNGVGPTLTDTATYEFGFLSTEDDPDAIHDNVAAEFSPLTGKSNPVGADLLLIEDSDDSFNKKKLILSNLLATLSTQSGFGIWQYAGDADTTPAAGKFSFDTSGIGIADHIYVHENNASGMDMALVLGSLKVDDIIYLGHSSLTTVGSMHKLTGTPTLTAGVWDIPVDGATSGATSSPNWVLNDFAYFVVLTADAGGAGGAGMDQKEYVSGGGAPAAAKMTANADALSSVTTLNLSDSSGVDNNFSIAYGAIKAGDFFVIRDNAGGGAHGTFEVVSSVDNTTYWTFTVTFKNVAGSFVATNDYDIWVLSAGGSGDVVGPASATNGAITLFDGTTGKLVKDLGATFTAASGGKFAVGMTNAYMRMKEKATAAASTAGQGDWWVKNDVPSAPKFTGDDGTDYYLLRSAAQPGNGRIQMGTTTGSIDDEAVFNYGTGSLNMTNAAGSRIRMKEAATKVATPLAGEGLWWVRSDTPNVPMFTDDAGTDFVLNASGSGDVSGGAASVANEIPTYGDTSGKLIGRSDILISSSTPTVGTRTLGANSVLAGGRIGTAGTITASGDGSIALGYATLTGGGTSAALSSTGAGSIVIGTALSNGASGNAKVEATNLGSIAMGYCNDTTGTSRISSLALGSMATGRAQLGSIIETTSFGAGGFSQGYATGGGIIRVSNEGALARGYSNGAGTTIISSGDGSLASGYASASGGLLASGNGAVAMGHGFGAAITASGEGSIAVGYGLFQAVTASGAGSGAFGQASGAAIVASAANSYQFGVGTNAQATSLQVGDTTDGVRLTGGGAPTTPHDGDIWVDASGDVNISSSGGGATAVVFNLPAITGSRGGNAALADLLTKLAAMNLITDSTT